MKYYDYINSLVNKEALNQRDGFLNEDFNIHDLPLDVNKQIYYFFSPGHYKIDSYRIKNNIKYFYTPGKREDVSEEDWYEDDEY